MEGQVMKVNKGRRQVRINLGDENNLFQTIWCPIEYVRERREQEQEE
jgi:hypothetical protein